MNDVTIKKIAFLTPAAVTYEKDGVSCSVLVSVDCRTQTVIIPPVAPPEIADLFFPFLNDTLRLPADAFEATEDVYREADKASQEFEKTHREHVGGSDG